MIRPDAGSWSGFTDSFGERAAAVDADGRSVELLRLSAAFTPAHQALADRIARLDVELPTVARALGLELDEPSARLILTSERVAGLRLSELLLTAVQKSVIADLGAALFVMRRLLTIAESLQTATGESHFAIDPGRIVVTPRARVLIVEPVLAAAIERRSTASTDIASIAVAGMSILLGRPIEDAENIDPLSPVLQDAADVAAIRAGDPFSTALRLWFDRAIIADPALSFRDFREARLALSRIKPPREAGCVALRQTLKTFLNEVAIEPLRDPEAAALDAGRIRTIRANQRARWKAISAPDEEWLPVEDELAIADEPALTQKEQPDDAIELSYEIGRETTEIQSLIEPDVRAAVEEPVEPTPAPASRSWFRSIAQQLGLASTGSQPPETDRVAPPEDVVPESPRADEAPNVNPALADADQWASSTWTEPIAEQTEAAQDEEPIEEVLEEQPIEMPMAETAALEEETTEVLAAESTAIEDEPSEMPVAESAAVEEEPIEVAAAESAAFEEEPLAVADAEPPMETVEDPGVEVEEPIATDAFEPSTPTVEAWAATHEESAAAIAQDVTAAIPEVDEPVSSAWTEPIAEEDEETPASVAEEEPIEAADTAPPDETIEELLPEAEEPIATEVLEPFTPMVESAMVTPEERPVDLTQDFSAASTEEAESTSIAWTEPVEEEAGTALEEREQVFADPGEAAPLESPFATVDESSEADLSEDEHKSWIRSITEQLGLTRREETVPEAESPGEPPETVEELETPPAEEAADAAEAEPAADDEPAEWIPSPYLDPFEGMPAVEATPMQVEPAPTQHSEEPPEQPGAWTTLQPAPWRDDASAAGRAMPWPAGPVDYDDAPHDGVVHEPAADAQAARLEAQQARLEAQPAMGTPRRRKIVVPAREWNRAIATILTAGVALAIVAALVIAGRSYYASVNTPGTIAVDSTPKGSEVLVDGTARGVTPLTLTLKPGDHVLELRRNGVARQFPIAVTPGARLSQQLDWSTVRATGTLAISSTPPRAKVTVDGKERGVTPLTVSDVPVGMRRVVIESSAGTVRRDVRVVADSTVTINETIISGWIAAFAPIELQIYEGTRLLGTTEDGRIMVRPGRHELDFVNTRLGYRERREVDVNPGTTTAVNITTVVGTVRITAEAGAEVFIDGARVGETPLDELRVPVGTHEILLRHPQLGEQRVSVTVGAAEPAEVNVDFSR